MKVEELKRKMDANEDILLVDVREDEELVAEPAIEGAKHVPMGRVFLEAGKGNLPKDKKILLVCKRGGRCAVLARELDQQGFDIDILEGGMDAWNEQN